MDRFALAAMLMAPRGAQVSNCQAAGVRAERPRCRQRLLSDPLQRNAMIFAERDRRTVRVARIRRHREAHFDNRIELRRHADAMHPRLR